MSWAVQLFTTLVFCFRRADFLVSIPTRLASVLHCEQTTIALHRCRNSDPKSRFSFLRFVVTFSAYLSFVYTYWWFCYLDNLLCCWTYLLCLINTWSHLFTLWGHHDTALVYLLPFLQIVFCRTTFDTSGQLLSQTYGVIDIAWWKSNLSQRHKHWISFIHYASWHRIS